jgi:O-succinylbenzoic acid--CoA ligase
MAPVDAVRKLGSAGKPLLFSQVRIVDETGAELPPGAPGEVIVRGPTVMQGYFNSPQATRAVLRDGWLYTGDIGYLDEEGDLWLVQRRSDLIVSGGENIFPAEVEAVLRRHPAVAEVCVVGLPDPEWGQRVAALVVAQPGEAPAVEELLAFSRQSLAGYKLPRLIRFVDQLPQTASAKIERKRVQQILMEMHADCSDSGSQLRP